MTVKTPELPIKVRNAMETLLRTANEENYILIGCLFHENGSIALLQNTKDDPAVLLHAVADMVEKKIEKGLITEDHVRPLN